MAHSAATSGVPGSRASWTATVFRALQSVITIAALVGIGWYGHATHWSFGTGEHASGPTAGAPSSPAPRRTSSAVDGIVRLSSREAVEKAGIEVVAADRRFLSEEVVANGVVAYDERRIAQLSARVPGAIWRVERHLGDVVQRGEILLFVDSQAVGAMKAAFLNALVSYETRQTQLAILEEVRGVVMGRQLREAAAALREARNQLTNAEQALVNLGFDVSAAEYEPLDDETRARRIRTLGLPGHVVDSVGAERITSNLLPLVAPFDGVVVGREAVVGEVVEPAQPIIDVANVSSMLVILDVAKEHAGKVATGQPVRFKPDGSERQYETTVSWINTEVNPTTRTLQVRAEVVGNGTAGIADGGLRANTFGRGRIEVAHRAAALTVPVRSLQWDGGRWIVFVPAGEAAFAARVVEPGLRDGEYVEIVEHDVAEPPLREVVGTGSHVLKSQLVLDRLEAGTP